MTSRILVLTEDVLGKRLAGPAIRATKIASALKTRGHDVRLVSTRPLEVGSPPQSEAATNPDRLRVAAAWAQVIVTQGPLLAVHDFLRAPNKIVVIDGYVPAHLEDLETRRTMQTTDRLPASVAGTHAQLTAMRRADFVLCATDRQRDLWLGHLAAVGRLNPALYDRDVTLQSFISVVPFGTEPGPPVRTGPGARDHFGIPPGDPLLLWGGGVYEWFDPITTVEAVNVVRQTVPNIRLVFMGLSHPALGTTEGIATRLRRRAEELGLTDSHVFFNESWVPYEDRHNWLLDADVGVSAHTDNLETSFSFRTRVLDYFWAGLPIVSSAGDAFAPQIKSTGCGKVVPPKDAVGFSAAVVELLEPRAASLARRASLQLAEEFRWDRVLEPLLEFCSQPVAAPDLSDPDSVRAIRRLSSPQTGHPMWRQWLGTTIHHMRTGGFRHTIRKAQAKIGRQRE